MDEESSFEKKGIYSRIIGSVVISRSARSSKSGSFESEEAESSPVSVEMGLGVEEASRDSQ